MQLAKPHLDIGLFTQDIEAQRAFWRETVGLGLDQELRMADGWVQHRFDAHGSVVKVNHWTAQLPVSPPTGYETLTIAREGAPAWQGRDPDGNQVRLVPPGSDGVSRIGITVASPDPARLMSFYRNVMEFEQIEPTTARCGDTVLFVTEGPGGSECDDIAGPGLRYITVQIFDADKACADIVARGGRLARAPVSVRDVARFGLIKDPDGNWIEISARRSLIGAARSPYPG